VLVAETLKAAGFDSVDLRRDLKVNDMRRALRDFVDKSREADVAVIYFAGHGMEVDGTNYLIPVDAVLERDVDIFDEALSLERVLVSVEPARQMRLVILDACRDNPFAKKMVRSSGLRSIGKGLGNIEPEGTTLVAYAAKHGQTAEDGKGRNSPYASAFIRNIQTPGLEINQVFRRVHDEVMNATGKRQQPFTYGALPSEPFVFRAK
jgi:uncharacterized caspase-like protein